MLLINSRSWAGQELEHSVAIYAQPGDRDRLMSFRLEQWVHSEVGGDGILLRITPNGVLGLLHPIPDDEPEGAWPRLWTSRRLQGWNPGLLYWNPRLCIIGRHNSELLP